MYSNCERVIIIFLPYIFSDRGNQSKETFKVTSSSVTDHNCYSWRYYYGYS